MDKLLKKIYDEVICYEKDVAEINREIESKNRDILKKYNDKLSEEEEEMFLELLDNVASSAEYKGFYIGVKYAFKIIISLFKN